MTLDLAKLRAETLALMDGTTPGPWDISRYAATHISAASRLVCSAGGYSANRRRKEDVRDENVANARLIAAAPTLAADKLRLVDDNLRLLDEIERLTAENARLRAEVERLRKAVIAAENGFRILMEPDLRAEMCSALRGDRHD